MVTKKKRSFGSIFKFLSLGTHALNIFRGLVYQLKVETYFTIKNVIILLMLSLMLGCLLMATWVSLLAMVFLWLIKLQWSGYIAAAFIMLLNIICLILLGIFITKTKNKLLHSSVLKHISPKE